VALSRWRDNRVAIAALVDGRPDVSGRAWAHFRDARSERPCRDERGQRTVSHARQRRSPRPWPERRCRRVSARML